MGTDINVVMQVQRASGAWERLTIPMTLRLSLGTRHYARFAFLTGNEVKAHDRSPASPLPKPRGFPAFSGIVRGSQDYHFAASFVTLAELAGVDYTPELRDSLGCSWFELLNELYNLAQVEKVNPEQMRLVFDFDN